MAIFLTESSKVIVQGMTGSEGRRHTQRMLRSGTAVVGGVTPGKGGQSVDFEGATVPVYGSVKDVVDATGADVSVVFVPPRFAKAAVVEAVDAGVVVRQVFVRRHDATSCLARCASHTTLSRIRSGSSAMAVSKLRRAHA